MDEVSESGFSVYRVTIEIITNVQLTYYIKATQNLYYPSYLR